MCDHCPMTFRSKYSLRMHLLTHDKNYMKPSLPCKFCGKDIKRKNMYLHVKRIHFDQGEEFPCSQCGKVFNNDFRLKKHIKFVHEKADSEECKLCGKKFPCPQNLRKHIDGVHKKLKPFGCKLCGHFFTQNGSLNLHLKNVHKIDKAKYAAVTDNSADLMTTSHAAPSTSPVVKMETFFPTLDTNTIN